MVNCLVCLAIDSALGTDYVPEEETRQVLSRYLSKLTLTDGDDLCLAKSSIPEGFHLIHRQCSKRSLCETSEGFTAILSKESTWRSDMIAEESRESVQQPLMSNILTSVIFYDFTKLCDNV